MINTKKAFSFIEVIIASSIIVIISVVAATNYSGMQDKTTNSKVLSDIQTLNNSILAYNKAKSEYPDPKGNQKFFGSNGEYKHAKDSDFVFGVSGFVSNNVIPKEFMNYLPIDPRTNQYYAYAKTIETNTNIKKQGFQIGGVVLENNTPKSLISGNYTGEQGPLDIIKDYTSPEFVPNDSTSLFPYNPEERVLVGKIQNPSAIAQVSVNGVTATENMQVGQGDLVKVASGATAEIYYSDGSSALLGDTTQDTVLHLTNLTYKEENNLLTNISQILKSGNILVKASSLDQGDTDSEFNVYTEDVVASVRGTIFNFNKTNTGSQVLVIEGKVDVNPTTIEVKNKINEMFTATLDNKEIEIKLPEKVETTSSGQTIQVEKGGVPKQIQVDTPIDVSVTAQIHQAIKLVSSQIETYLNDLIPATGSGTIETVSIPQEKKDDNEKIFYKEIDVDKLSSEVLNEPLTGTGYIKVNGLDNNTEIVLKFDPQQYILTNTGIKNLTALSTTKTSDSIIIKYNFGSDQISQICKNISIAGQETCGKYGMESAGDKCTTCIDLEGEKKISTKQDTIVDLLKNGPTTINDLNSTLKFSTLTSDELQGHIKPGYGSSINQQLVFLDNTLTTIQNNSSIFWKIFKENDSIFLLKDISYGNKRNIKKACIVLTPTDAFNGSGYPDGFNNELKNNTLTPIISNCVKEQNITFNLTQDTIKNITKSIFSLDILNSENNWSCDLQEHGLLNIPGKRCDSGKKENTRNYLILQTESGSLIRYNNGDFYVGGTKLNINKEKISKNLGSNIGKITKICRDTWLYLQDGEGPRGREDVDDYKNKCKNTLGSDFKFNTSSDNYRNYTGNSKVYGGRHSDVTDGNTGDTKYILCTTCDY